MKINNRYIRYGFLITSFIIIIYTINVFLQNFNINKNIQELKEKQLSEYSETIWLKKYYKSFLKSDYAKLFSLHNVGLPYKNEILFKINKYDLSIKNESENNKYLIDKNMGDSKKFWNYFFSTFFLKFK